LLIRRGKPERVLGGRNGNIVLCVGGLYRGYRKRIGRKERDG